MQGVRIDIIQVLRGVAAVMVLFYHTRAAEQKYTGFSYLSGWTEYGMYGVDIFFFISGFIITWTTINHAPSLQNSGRFFIRRAIRIYPLYWLITTAVLFLYLVRPDMVNASATNEPHILRSYLLLPQHGTPLLAVGWTLVYEMYFYLVFALLLLTKRKALPFLLIIWAVFVCFLHFNGPYKSPLMEIASSLMCLEFIAGAALAYIPSIANRIQCHKILLLMGDASYAIYLSHVLVISLLGRIWYFVGNEQSAFHLVWLCLTIISAIIAGIIIHLYIEKPIAKAIKQLLGRKNINPVKHEIEPKAS